MSLQAELDRFKKSFQEQAPQDALDVMNRATLQLAKSGILDGAVKEGDRIADFSLENQDGVIVNLADLLGSGPVVINVFRGVWCPYCNIELKALNGILQELAKRHTTLVGLAPQRRASALKNKKDLELGFDLLVDKGNAYARKLGICYDLPGELIDIYRNFSIDLPTYNEDESWQLPMPARLVVAGDYQVIYADVSPDYTVRPEPQKLLDVLDSV